MSSWADVAAKNAPPPSEQPQPDQNLLEGHFDGEEPTGAPLDGGVVVAPHDFKENPTAVETPATVQRDAEYAEKQAAEAKADAEKQAQELAAEAEEVKEEVKDKAQEVSAKAGETARDLKAKAEEAGEGIRHKAVEAEKYLSEEAKKAKAWAEKEGKEIKKEGASIYRSLVSILSQPRVFVPLISALDLALLGFLGLQAQKQQEFRRPFDRRVVSAVAVGVGALFSIQGVAANAYFSKRNYDGTRK